MSNKFQVEVSARDNTSAVLDRIADSVDRLNDSFKNTNRQTQQNTQQNTRNNRELTRTQQILNRIKRIGQTGQRVGQGTILGDASGGIGRIAGEASGLESSVSTLNRSMMALGASLAAITVYGAKQAIKWADDAQSMDNFAHSVGMNVKTLQEWQNAAKLAGISQDAMMSNIQGFGQIVRQSLIGQNAQAAMAFKQLGVEVTYGKDGLADYNKALLDSVRALDKLKSPQLRQAAADTLGLSALLPVLGRGDDRVQKLLKRTTQTGAIRPEEQVKQAAKTAIDINAARMAGKGAERNVADLFMGATGFGANILENLFSQGAGQGQYQRMIDTPSPDASRIYVPGRGFMSLKDWQKERQNIRGIRQNNPMNLRSWQGYPQKGGFAQFPNMETGLQKGAIQLRRYGARGIDTLSGIAKTYAPSNENDTLKYLKDLTKITGYEPNAKLDLNNQQVLQRLITAQSQLETGYKPSATQSANAAAQAMQVNIQVNAPSGTTTTATVTSGGQTLQPRISHSMPLIPE